MTDFPGLDGLRWPYSRDRWLVLDTSNSASIFLFETSAKA